MPTLEVMLGWGRAPLGVRVPSTADIWTRNRVAGTLDWRPLIEAALDAPVGSAPLSERLKGVRRACVLVPDDTRKSLNETVLPVVLDRLEAAGIAYVVGVATGKHPPVGGPQGALLHDATAADLVPVGETAHGTKVAYPPWVLDAELRIVLGEIRPHYFAGYAGGAKGIFPGVAGAAGIWHNHELKAVEGARLGVVAGNPCRADMEAAAALAGPAFLVNIVRGQGDGLVGAVAGDLVRAHRAGVALARPVFERPAHRRYDTVLVSDASPVSMNLYQACKLLPPAGALLAPGGTVIMAAECFEGIGPVETINRAIYALGVRHALPAEHRVILVSGRPREDVAPTFAQWSPSVEAALNTAGPGALAVLPRAGDMVPVLGAPR